MMWYIYTYIHVYMYIWMLFSNDKEGNPAIWDTDGPGGNYAKWDKSEKDHYAEIIETESKINGG